MGVQLAAVDGYELMNQPQERAKRQDKDQRDRRHADTHCAVVQLIQALLRAVGEERAARVEVGEEDSLQMQQGPGVGGRTCTQNERNLQDQPEVRAEGADASEAKRLQDGVHSLPFRCYSLWANAQLIDTAYYNIIIYLCL